MLLSEHLYINAAEQCNNFNLLVYFMNIDQAQVQGHTRSTHTVAYMYVHYIVISFVNYISC